MHSWGLTGPDQGVGPMGAGAGQGEGLREVGQLALLLIRVEGPVGVELAR